MSKSKLQFALLLFILSFLFIYSTPLSVISENPESLAIDGNVELQIKRSTMSTLSNDGGSSLNNATTDNGNWQFYGIGDQTGVNSRSDLVYPYSLYFEKAVLVLTNWARMSPSGFRSRFLNLFSAGKTLETSGLAPLFEHFNLAEAARYHSKDMATTPCFQHASCDGEGTFVRVKSFYNRNVAMAENIAAGQTSPLAVTMGWINSDGHRANIIGAYTLLGVGYYPKISSTAPYNHYWTQNFAGGTHGISNAIVAATHMIFSTNVVTFLANYYHKSDLTKGLPPLSVSIFIDDIEYPMSIPASNRYTDSSLNAGTFEYNSTRLSSGTACRKYYIRAIDSTGFKYYYPSVGYLLTQGENSACTSNYLRAVRPGETSSCTGVNNCNGNGQCIANNVCVCNSGYKGTACNQFSCDSVSNCNSKGTCTGPNNCTCNSGYTGTSCNIVTCNLLNNCNGNGTCTAPNVCTCKTGYVGLDCSILDCSTKGNCNGNGICSGPNTCTCFPGYRGSTDCKTISCENLNNCNGNGVCSGPNVCTCRAGYLGSADCKTLSCELVSHCSGKGTCSGPNTCTCAANYYGRACDLGLDVSIVSPSFTSSQIVYTPGSMNIAFRSSVSSFSSYSSLTYKWTQVSGPTISNLENISVSGTDKKDFGIKSGSLTEGSSYTFRLNVTRIQLGESTFATKDIKITINRLPTISSFKIVNTTNGLEVSSGLAVKTTFRSSMVATNPGGFAMQYAFGFYTPDNRKVFVSELSSSSTSPIFTLPYYTSGQVTVFFAVRDSAFGYAERTKVMTIQDPTTTMSSQEVNLLVKSLINSTTLTVLETATSLLNSAKISSTEKISIRSEILNQVVASTESESSKIAILESLTSQPSEISPDATQKTLNLLLNIASSLKGNLQDSDRNSIIKTVSQSISTISTSNSAISSLLGKVIDASQVGASISLIEGQSSISTSNFVKTALIKSTIDNFSFSPSQIGLPSLNLPKEALKQLLSSKFQLDASTNSFSIALSVISHNIYSHIKSDLVSSIISISILSNNGTRIAISELSSPIEFEVDITGLNSTSVAQCQFYNTQTSQFSSTGLQTDKVSDLRVKCRTVHLTDFAISETSAEQSINKGSLIGWTKFQIVLSLMVALILILQ